MMVNRHAWATVVVAAAAVTGALKPLGANGWGTSDYTANSLLAFALGADQGSGLG